VETSSLHCFRTPCVQFLLVGALGAGLGFAYRTHRTAEKAWSSTHYRLDERVGFPMSRGIPFGQQFILDAEGGRIEVPLPEGQEIDFNGATWWSVDGSGRMRTWNKERVEVFPTLLSGP
jgi:hypothetical protein